MSHPIEDRELRERLGEVFKDFGIESSKLTDECRGGSLTGEEAYSRASALHKRAVDEATQLIRSDRQEHVREAKEQFHSHYSGKPEKMGECDDCGSKYWIDWVVPHPVFNAVCPKEGYLCLPCFAKRMEVMS